MEECGSLAELMAYFSDKCQNLKQCMELRAVGDSSTCLAVLRSIHQQLKETEGALEEFCSGVLETEKRNLDQARAVLSILPQYSERLNHIYSHLPSHLPGAPAQDKIKKPSLNATIQSARIGNALPQEQGRKVRKHARTIDQSSSKINIDHSPVKIPYLTVEEFETVPKYVKGRIHYDQVNKAIDEIHKVIGSKYKILKIPRSAMGEPVMKKYKAFKEAETAETEGRFFFVADDLKNFSQMKLDSSGKTSLAVLRSCGCLKEVRGGGIMRYVIQT